MSTDQDKRKSVRIFNAKTGEVRLSDPMPVHATRSDSPEVSASLSLPEATELPPPALSNEPTATAGNLPGAELPNSAVVAESSESLDSPPLSDVEAGEASAAEPRPKAGSSIKPKVDIETLEQFIAYAYSRKGQRVTLKPKTERLIARNPRLDDGAISRLQTLTESDVLLAIPRQLLLVSREVEGLPELRATLNSFVSAVMFRHPVFANEGVQAAVRNLPDAPPIAEALRTVVTCVLIEVEGKDRLKPSDLQALRQNAANLLVTWFACNRGLHFEDIALLLFHALWGPAARDLSDDNARLRALTGVEQPAGIGLVCQRFRQQATEARFTQEQAEREAAELRQQVAQLGEQLQQAQAEREALFAELQALRVSSANELIELRARHDAERMHLRHELEQLRGRLVRRLDESVEMLEVGLTALRNKTPRTEVMAERAEHVVDALRAELANLKEE